MRIKQFGFNITLACLMSCGLALSACQNDTNPDASAKGQVIEVANVDMERLSAASTNPGEWLSVGKNFGESRFSELSQINAQTIGSLQLEWFADLDTSRGQEATPLVIDGVMYVSTAWSMVKAYDAKTGGLLWSFDPEVPKAWAANACCDAVNRGVAAWKGKIYVGTLDGRLIALDAKSGNKVWEKNTIDRSKPYTITGAPRIVKDLVIIGNGGAEFGVRGYVAAYDVETGKEVWKFYTVPGNPADGFENDAMKMAAETWTGEWWTLGGGGTVWDSMAYDEQTDLLYIGVGNGSPWNAKVRSPEGGDNLFLSSIVAVKPDTGEYVWHFQTTPSETWDYTATQHIIVTDLELDGQTRKVVMQAPKNGFFYVLDAYTGEFISGKNFVPINWAEGLDETGRPIENPAARYDRNGELSLVLPGPGGAHSWHPMSYSPETGLVYISANIAAFPYMADPDFKALPVGFNVANDFSAGAMPANPAIQKEILKNVAGPLIAWDPVKQEAAWQVMHPGTSHGGTLSTKGNLVFQGTKSGEFAAYNATTGEKLWAMDAQSGILAAPMSFEMDGKQYIAVLAGWGGIEALAPGIVGTVGHDGRPNRSRVLVFSLTGETELPPVPDHYQPPLNPPAFEGTSEQADLGSKHYARLCGVCHGDAANGSGHLPNLKYSGYLYDEESFSEVVYDGALSDNGMIGFSEAIGRSDVEAVRQYLIFRANEDLAYMKQAEGK